MWEESSKITQKVKELRRNYSMKRINKEITNNLNPKEQQIKIKIEQAFDQYIKIPGGRLSVKPTLLRSFGDWIYKHLHLDDDYSFFLSLLIFSGFNQTERKILWSGFEKNIKEDYSDLISFILEEIIKHSKKYKFYIQEIIDEYVAQLTESEYAPDFKAYIQLCLAESAMLVMDDIIDEKIGIPNETFEGYKQLCLNLEKYIDFNIGTAYIEHLIGESEIFPDAYELIHNMYFNVENN